MGFKYKACLPIEYHIHQYSRNMHLKFFQTLHARTDKNIKSFCPTTVTDFNDLAIPFLASA